MFFDFFEKWKLKTYYNILVFQSKNCAMNTPNLERKYHFSQSFPMQVGSEAALDKVASDATTVIKDFDLFLANAGQK